MKCPDCEDGELFVYFAKMEDPHQQVLTTMPCFRCKGTTEIPDEMLVWMKLGEKLKQERLNKGLGLRECACKYGVLPGDWSDAEQGRNETMLKMCYDLFGMKIDV